MRVSPASLAVALCVVAVACTSTARLDTSALSFSQEPLIGKVVWNV